MGYIATHWCAYSKEFQRVPVTLFGLEKLPYFMPDSWIPCRISGSGCRTMAWQSIQILLLSQTWNFWHLHFHFCHFTSKTLYLSQSRYILRINSEFANISQINKHKLPFLFRYYSLCPNLCDVV